MKCLNKQARHNKAKLEAEREAEKEQARWDSLTPEEQEIELAQKRKRQKELREAVGALGAATSLFGMPYENFKF